jgi:hypothetical protein
LVENLLLDVRYALRVLRKSPAFTAGSLVTLMLGIGANVVVFGVLNAVLLHPLDVSDPVSLYQIRHKQWMIGRLLTTSYPAFEDFRQRNTTFSGMAGVYGYSYARLSWHERGESISTAMKSPGIISICWGCSRRLDGSSTRRTSMARGQRRMWC